MVGHTTDNKLKEILRFSYNLTDDQINCYLELLKLGGMDKEEIINRYEEETITKLEEVDLIRKFPKNGGFYIPTPPQEIALKIVDKLVDILRYQYMKSNRIVKEINGILLIGQRNRNLSAKMVKGIIKNAPPGEEIKLRVRRLSTFKKDVYPDFASDIIEKQLDVKVLLVSESSPREEGIKTAQYIISQLKGYENKFQVRISKRKSEHLRYLIAGNIVMFVIGTGPAHTGVIIEDEKLKNIFSKDFDSEFKNGIPLEKYIQQNKPEKRRKKHVKKKIVRKPNIPNKELIGPKE